MPSPPQASPALHRWLLAWALAYGVGHHLGLLPDGLGDAGGSTRWADWLDLALPWLVVVPALAALREAGTDRRGWSVALAGAGLYVQGHAVHLAANSVGEARGDAPPVHLWDEVVGHALWYGGFAVLVAVLARAVAPTGLRAGPVAAVLALLTGSTWATNAVGADGLVLPGLAVAALLAALGWRLRRCGAGVLLMTAFGTSAAGLAVTAAVGGPA